MIRILIFYLLTALLLGCNYTATSFIIENESSEDVVFDATAIIPHRLLLNKQRFELAKNEKVLLRHVDLSQKGDITNLFTEINFLNTEIDSIDSAMLPENWVESYDEKGNRIFTYTIE